MPVGMLNEPNPKKTSWDCQEPLSPETAPSEGKRISPADWPCKSKILTCETTLRTYRTKILPAASDILSNGTSDSGTISFQASRRGSARLTKKMCHFGAFQLVRTKSLPSSICPKKSDSVALTFGWKGFWPYGPLKKGT